MLHFFIKKNFSTRLIRHSRFCVIGGGTAGLNFISQMRREKRVSDIDFTVFDPNHYHYYQPGWTLVGSGQLNYLDTFRDMRQVIPKNVKIVDQSVTLIKAKDNLIQLESGDQWTYDHLILCPGTILDWSQIKNARQCLNDPDYPVSSNYSIRYARKQFKILSNFQGGNFVFSEPQMPIKCGGAPQKALFLATDFLNKKGLEGKFEINYFCAKGTTFGVARYAKTLEKIHEEYGTKMHHFHKLIEIKKEEKIAVFQQLQKNENIEVKFDALHIVPPQIPPKFIADSGLADEAGYAKVNGFTLQHLDFPNIWSLGDGSNVPTSKTAAAIFSQTPVLVKNLKQIIKGYKPTNHYDGYTSCPIPVGKNRLVLCEFKFNGEIDETFPFDQSKPRYLFYLIKLKIFPLVYWTMVPQGYWYGKNTFLPIIRKLFN